MLLSDYFNAPIHLNASIRRRNGQIIMAEHFNLLLLADHVHTRIAIGQNELGGGPRPGL